VTDGTIAGADVDPQFSIDGGATWSATGTFTALAPGTYTLQVRNTGANCYVDAGLVTIESTDSATITAVSFTEPTDCGSVDGTITIAATGGTGGLEYSIDNGTTFLPNGGTFTGLAGGTYNIIVRNVDDSCPVNYATAIILTDKVAPSVASITPLNITDCNETNGSITVNATGSGALEYGIDGVYQTGNVFANLTAGTYNITVRNADGTCTTTAVATTITAPTAGTTDGTTAAVTEFSLDGINWQTATTFSGLSAGTYNVFARNAGNTCEIVLATTVMLTAPSSPTITDVSFTDPIDCTLANDGTITITAIDGVGTLQYNLTNGGSTTTNSTGTFSGLSAGDYTITVTNQDGSCVTYYSTVLTLTAPVTPTNALVSSTNPTDCAEDNGTITITADNIGLLEFSIDGGTTWTSNSFFSSLPAGDYPILVRNENGGCQESLGTTTLIAPTEPSAISIASTDATNCDNADGTITITATQGTIASANVALEYSIDGGATWQASNTFTALATGTYTIQVRNTGATCIVDAGLATINATDAATITGVSFTEPTDCGNVDGTITITATGGTGGLEYSIDNGTTFLPNGGTFTGLAGGTYNVIVRNIDDSCPVNYATAIILTDKVTPTVSSIVSSNVTDCNETNGQITVTATGGGALEYGIDGVYQTGNVFDNLPAGSFTITVRNADGTCTSAGVVEIITAPTAPTAFAIDVQSDPNDCDTNDGTFTVSGTAGSAAIEWSIDNGFTWQTSGTFASLGAGTYNVLARNVGETCQTMATTVTLTAPSAAIITNIASSNVSDCGLAIADGEIEITASSTVALEYSNDGGTTWQTTSVFNNLPAGSYDIQIRNAVSENCLVQGPIVEITAPSAPTFIGTEVVSTNVTDCDEQDGSITIYANGAGALEYSVDGGTTWNSNNYFSSLPAGTYDIEIRNAGGTCEVAYATQQVITIPTAPNTFSIVSQSNPTDCDAVDGTFEVSGTNGSATVEWSIDGGFNWQTSGVFAGLGAGTYNILARNNGSTCQVNATQVTLTSPDAATITNVISSDISDCSLVTADGSITVTAIGTEALEYSHDNGVNWQTTGNFTNLIAGTYQILVRNAANDNCLVTGPIVTITEPVAPTISSVSPANPMDCGSLDGSISIIADGTQGLEYSIDNQGTYQSSNLFINLAPGTYNVWVRYDNNTCPVNYGSVTLTTPTSPTITNVTSTTVNDCSSDDATIDITATGGVSPLQYSINGGITWGSANLFTGLSAGNYYIKVRNTDGSCEIDFASNPVVITAPAAPVISSVLGTNPTDCGVTDGNIQIFAGGGSGSFQYSINGGTDWQASNTFTNLAGATYTIAVRNADMSCEVSGPQIILTSPTAPSVTGVVATNPTDCSVNDGVIDISANGAGGLEYSIDGGTSWQSSNLFINLAPNTYDIYVRNDDGSCETQYLPSITLSSPNVVAITSVTSMDPSDCNLDDGTITINATPTTGLEYSIDGINWATTSTFTDLASGNYSIFVRNTDGSCEVAYGANVTLNAPNAATITNVAATNPTDCSNVDGTITISTTGGSSVEYSIDGGANYFPTNSFTGLADGAYPIFVRNGDLSCSIAGPTINISSPVAATISTVTSSNPTNCNIEDGTITIIADGNTGLEYTIDGGITWQSSNIFINLAQGTYNDIRVRNDDGTCEVTYGNIITLESPTAPSISAVDVTQPTNCDTANGEIMITATAGTTDGTTAATIQYSIDGTNWQFSNTFAGLAGGAYFIYVRNEGGDCIVEWGGNSVILNSAAAPVISSVVFASPTNCTGTDNGSVSITATGGVAPLQYTLNNGITTETNTTGNFAGLDAGSYTVSVTNADGTCGVFYAPVIMLLEVNTPQNPGFTFTNPTECDADNGTITITADNVGSLEYSIDNGVFL